MFKRVLSLLCLSSLENTTLQQPYILFNPAIITPLNAVFDEMFLNATVDKASYSATFKAFLVYFIHMVLDYGNKKLIAGWVNTIGSGMSVMYPTLSDGSNNKEKLCKWLRGAENGGYGPTVTDSILM
jgi:hypothetical protein